MPVSLANMREYTSFGEQGLVAVTFKYDGSIVYDGNHYDLGQGAAQVGDAVVLVSDSTVGLGASGGYPIGKLAKVESDGFCSVLVGTVLGFHYLGGSIPAVGRGITVDGAGNAQQAPGGTRVATEKGTVVALDTTNLIAYVLMF